MPQVTSSHPLWPWFSDWYKTRFGPVPNLSIKADLEMWTCFLQGASASRQYETQAGKDMGLVITQEGPQEDK